MLSMMALGGPPRVLAQESSFTTPIGRSLEFNATGQEKINWHTSVEGRTQEAVAAVSTPFSIIRPSITTASKPGRTPHHAKTYTRLHTFGCLDLLTLQPIPNRNMTIEPVRIPDTGGHPEAKHTSGRSTTKDGKYDLTVGNTGSDGLQYRTTYTSGEVAGEIEVKLTCFKEDGVTVSSTGSVFIHVRIDEVSIDELVSLPASYPTYVFEGNDASNIHQDSHYVRKETRPKVLRLADIFFAEQNKNNRTPKIYIRINDASLVWGGVFDDDGIATTGNWRPPHGSHRVGEDFDVDNTLKQKGTGTVPDGPDWTVEDRTALVEFATSTAVRLEIIEEGSTTHIHFRDRDSTYRP
jgi:hypothetical protein